MPRGPGQPIPQRFSAVGVESERLPLIASDCLHNAVRIRHIGSDLRLYRTADESACTPGSVSPGPYGSEGGGHPSRADVAAGLVRSTRELGRAALKRSRRGPVGPLLDLAPGGVYLAGRVTPAAGGLLHHRFTLTRCLTAPGGLFSVALSRGSPRVGITYHPALWSPDVPRRDPKIPSRPPGRLVRRSDHGSRPRSPSTPGRRAPRAAPGWHGSGGRGGIRRGGARLCSVGGLHAHVATGHGASVSRAAVGCIVTDYVTDD